MPHQELTLSINNPIAQAIVFGVLLIIALKRVQYLIGVYCAGSSIISAVLIGPTTLLHFVFVLGILGASLNAIREREVLSFVFGNMVNVTLLIFVAILILNLILISPDEERGLLVLKYLFLFTLIPYFLLQFVITEPSQLRDFMKAFIATSLCLGLVSLTLNFAPNSMANASGPARLSLIVDPITFALPLASAIIFSLYFFLGVETTRLKGLYGLATNIFLVVILLSGTRQAIIPLLPPIGILFYLQRRLRSAIYFVATSVVLLAGFYALEMSGNTRLENRYTHTIENISGELAPRTEMWSRAYEDFMSSPVIGIGIGGFGDYQYNERTGRLGKDHTHNLLLELLAEEGLFGFAFFVFWLCQVLRCWFKIRNSLNYDLQKLAFPFLCIIIFGLIQSNFSGGLLGGSTHIFWASSCLVIIQRCIQKEAQTKRTIASCDF